MSDVSTFRLYLLRATYLLIAVGLGFVIWPNLLHHHATWALRYGGPYEALRTKVEALRAG